MSDRARVRRRPSVHRSGRRPRYAIFILLAAISSASTSASAQQYPDPPQPPAEDEAHEPDEKQEATATKAARDEQKNDLADLSLEELMNVQVVVTASRRKEKINTVPYAITVITADEIRASGARAVPDALRLVPGIDVADLSSDNWAVSPRGFHGFLGRHILVLVDGRQIFDSLFGGSVWGAWPFQLEDIDRIEVILGPGGVTWGANAVNGVINIITKDPEEQLGTVMTLGAGNRGIAKQHVGHAFRDGKLRLRLSAEYERNDGFLTGGSIIAGLDDEYQVARAGVHGIYDAGPDDIFTFSAGSSVVDGGFPRSPLAGFGWARHDDAQSNFITGEWEHRVAEHNRYQLTGYINDYQGSAGSRQVDYRYQQFALQFGHTLEPKENHRVAWGIDTRFDLLDGSNADPQMLSEGHLGTGIIGAYVDEHWRFAPRWTLDLGGRMDYEFYGGFEPSARAALAYELDESSLIYGSVSRAFQMTPLGARFLEMPELNGLIWAKGHQDVKAEHLWAYELGYRGVFANRLHTSLNLFWNEYTDLTTLSPRLGPPGLLTLDLDNRASASIYGLEIGTRYVMCDQLTLLANYTYQHQNWDASVPYHDKDLISPPSHKAMIGAVYSPAPDLRLSAYLHYVDDVKAPRADFPFVARRIDSYLKLDVRMEYFFADQAGSVAFGVRNVLDNRHPEGGTIFLNDAEVPRTAYIELRLALKYRERKGE